MNSTSFCKSRSLSDIDTSTITTVPTTTTTTIWRRERNSGTLHTSLGTGCPQKIQHTESPLREDRQRVLMISWINLYCSDYTYDDGSYHLRINIQDYSNHVDISQLVTVYVSMYVGDLCLRSVCIVSTRISIL